MKTSPICPFCDGPEVLEVLEVWPDHTVQFETCCLARHEYLCEQLAEDVRASQNSSGSPKHRLLISDAVGWPVRRLVAHGPTLLIDYRLRIRGIRFRAAADFVEKHHDHCRRPAGWKFGSGIYSGGTLVGVVMVGRPVARALDSAGDTLEVNRLCLDRTLPDALRSNAASQLCGHAARETQRRGHTRIITYTRCDEAGTSLRAAGWDKVATRKAGQWNCTSRPRKEGEAISKFRWERRLTPSRKSQLELLGWHLTRRTRHTV